MTTKTFTVVGITELDGVAKVRFANDLVRRVKQFNKSDATRVTFVELPTAMTKIEALGHMLTMDEFQSEDDQATIQDTIEDKKKDALKGTIRVRKPKPSLEEIKSRARNEVTVADILDAAGI
jgi:hypothetical protein